MRNRIHTGGPAFPRVTKSTQLSISLRRLEGDEGLTKRDYFAAKMLEGMVSGFIASGVPLPPQEDANFARRCYAMADAMLEARDA